jgi:hypothetical protein
MNRKRIFLYLSLLIIISLILITWRAKEKSQSDYSAPEIAIREIGHRLLLSSKDSTSLILPVKELEPFKFKLSFNVELSIVPDSLVDIIMHTFKKAQLSEYYIVEVRHCEDNQVAYSYKMRNEIDKSIIPCSGRFLPTNCYEIEISLIDRLIPVSNKSIYIYILLLVLVFVGLDIFILKKLESKASLESNSNHMSIGSFLFYPDQNKLVKQAIEIPLSMKECELLAIFVANPNQVIKRDELMKKVWEDKGVVVGRSLDTYISKLRKILKGDESIKLVNVHGVGYKLELD